jgi:hypothetical protein
MTRVVNFLIFLLLVPLLVSMWVAGLHFFASIPDPSLLLWFSLGLLVSLLVGGLMVGPRSLFIGTASHELAHSFVGSVFLRRTVEMQATSAEFGEAGRTRLSPSYNTLARLAPYYFPTFTIPFLLIKPFVAGGSAQTNLIIDLLIGLSLGFHYDLCLKQLGFHQTDVSTTGYVASYGIIFTLMLTFLVLVVAVVTSDYSGLRDFALASVTRAPEYYRLVFARLSAILGR